MIDVLSQRVLVLNNSWQPINVIPAFEAICKVYKGSAHIIASDYSVHSFESWIKNWEDITSLSETDKLNIIHSSNVSFAIPEIIKVSKFYGYKKWRIKFSRKNIFERDNHTCQYCAKVFPTSKLNIDHIIPRSKGGKTSWENVALSCISCNTKKRDRTPEEANMPLIRKPFKPKWAPIKGKLNLNQKTPISWDDFVGSLYWESKLENE